MASQLDQTDFQPAGRNPNESADATAKGPPMTDTPSTSTPGDAGAAKLDCPKHPGTKMTRQPDGSWRCELWIGSGICGEMPAPGVLTEGSVDAAETRHRERDEFYSLLAQYNQLAERLAAAEGERDDAQKVVAALVKNGQDDADRMERMHEALKLAKAQLSDHPTGPDHAPGFKDDVVIEAIDAALAPPPAGEQGDRVKAMEAEVERLNKRHAANIVARDAARQRADEAVAAKDAAEKRLGELQYRLRVPDGAVRADAWFHDGTLIVCGTPGGEDTVEDIEHPDAHNCDAMGCSSVSHVIVRERMDPRFNVLALRRECRDSASAAARAAVERVREKVEGLPRHKPILHCGTYVGEYAAMILNDSGHWLDRDAVLAALDGAGSGETAKPLCDCPACVENRSRYDSGWTSFTPLRCDRASVGGGE